MRKTAQIKAILLLAAATIASGAASAMDNIMIEGPWVRSAPPGTKVMAGYMTISNHSHSGVTLTGVESPSFEKVELHQSYTHNGMSHMKQIERIEIPSHGSLKLEPGSYHLMLINPQQRVNRGDNIKIKLNFGNASSVDTSATVRDDMNDNGGGHHGHHKHH